MSIQLFIFSFSCCIYVLVKNSFHLALYNDSTNGRLMNLSSKHFAMSIQLISNSVLGSVMLKAACMASQAV